MKREMFKSERQMSEEAVMKVCENEICKKRNRQNLAFVH